MNLKKLWYSIFTPEDYYENLVSEELDISKNGAIKRFKFSHKYVGNYDVGILLNNFSTGDVFFAPSKDRYKLKLKMAITFFTENNLIMSKFVEYDYSPFMGKKDNSGLMFIFYKVPDDLPVNKLIECEVKIVEPDEYLYKTFGPVKFYISKMSDK